MSIHTLTDTGWQRFAVTIDGDVLTVTLNRPHTRNSVDLVLMEELVALSRALRECEDLRFVIFDHEGPVFSSGADLKNTVALLEADPTARERNIIRQQRLGQEMLAALEGVSQVTIAKLRGGAYGAGMALMLTTDFRVMERDTVLNLPETRAGTFLTWGCTARLTAAVGALKAKELILVAEDVPSDECLRLNLVNAAVTADEIDPWVDRLIGKLRDRGELAVDITKKLVGSASVPHGANVQFVEPHLVAHIAGSGQMLEGFRRVMSR